MKIQAVVFLSLIAFFQISSANDAFIKGVNYDPVHSFDFAKAVGLDNKQGMIDAIYADLDKLAELQNNGFKNIQSIKTFFTIYSSLGVNPANRVDVNIADVVHTWNTQHPQNAIKLALGVYEFRPQIDGCSNDYQCDEWTQSQVNAAIISAHKYPDLITRIIVGNEDIGDDATGMKLQTRIAADINQIKNQLQNKSILVGTAQTSDTVYKIFALQKYTGVKNAADFIGANVYPYWSGISYGRAPYTDSPAKQNLESYWNTLNHLKNNYSVISTEEGWPSAGNTLQEAIPNPDEAHDYLYYWYYRDTKITPISYYFALFDKTPGAGTESHWGIFSADRNASLLGSSDNSNDYSKPLAKGHALIQFNNMIGQMDGAYRITSLNACTNDWDPSTKTQGICYPIDGYNHTGDIPMNASHQFMIDTTGQTYSSLLVVFYADAKNTPRLCYINTATLKEMSDKTQVNLQWQTPDGAVPCHLKS
jgi:exo-beta-1,3-glucanase (GH17 family)